MDYIVVVVDRRTQKCVGVDFCESEDQLLKSARRYQEDFGEGSVVITSPSLEAIAINVGNELARLESEHRSNERDATEDMTWTSCRECLPTPDDGDPWGHIFIRDKDDVHRVRVGFVLECAERSPKNDIYNTEWAPTGFRLPHCGSGN